MKDPSLDVSEEDVENELVWKYLNLGASLTTTFPFSFFISALADNELENCLSALSEAENMFPPSWYVVRNDFPPDLESPYL